MSSLTLYYQKNNSVSTTQQLLLLTEYISSGLDRKCSTIAVFLDISEVYVSVWHSGFQYKLIQMRVPVKQIKVIGSYLAHKSFRVRMDWAVSEWKPMLVGVPQDFPLSPMLFNLYTWDIPKSIRTLCGWHLHFMAKTKVRGSHIWPCSGISNLEGGHQCGASTSLLRRQRLESSQRKPGCNGPNWSFKMLQ